MTLRDLLDSFGDYVEDRDGMLVHCPAHSDSDPSLRLTISDAGKVLIKCRAGCSTRDVLDKLGLTMRDLATMKPGEVELTQRATSRDVPASPEDVARLRMRLDRYAAQLLASEGRADALPYAAERFGATEEDAERLGLGYADDLGGGPRLVVPFNDPDGVARGFQARALDPDANVRWLGPKSPEGASWSKLAWFSGTSNHEEVLICEGPGDALTGACALGYDTIGVRGAALVANPAVVTELVDWLDGRPAVVAGDGDPAGRRFSSELAAALVEYGVHVRILPVADGLDLTDWRKRAGDSFTFEATKAVQDAAPVASKAEARFAQWDEDRYSLTDLGGARYLRDYIESRGSGVRYTDEGGFYLLHGGVWRVDTLQEVRTYAQEVADYLRELAALAMAEAAKDTASEYEKKRAGRFNKFAVYAQSARGLDAITRELQAVKGVPASINDFDRHPHLLAVRNGVINLRTGELMPHDPRLMLSRLVDVDYRPDAKAPRWTRFLTEVFPDDPSLPAYMQQLIGYGITGYTDESCFVVNWGHGANGKSVFTDVLSDVFGDHAVTTPFSTFEIKSGGGIPNDVAALKGARLVMASEGEQGKPMAEAMLKRLTGGDKVTARFMRREFFTFKPEFLLLLATNYKPNFKGQDEGLWRRVKLIRWNRYFKPEERDTGLTSYLVREEGEGILAWAVAGARQWFANGRRLRDPDSIREATREYRETSDALTGFIPGVFVVDPTSKHRYTGKEIHKAYTEWADEEGLQRHEIWKRRTLFSAVVERGAKQVAVTGGVAFDGLRRATLKPKDDAKVNEVVRTPSKGESADVNDLF